MLANLRNDGYGLFVEWFGFHCVDGDVTGKAGHDVESYMFRKTRRHLKWPLIDDIINADEDALFDVLEFLHDSVSEPIDKWHHSFGGCGWHYIKFDQIAGQSIYRSQINELLRDYVNGYTIIESGEIEAIHPAELGELMQNELPCKPEEQQQVGERVNLAVKLFRNRHSGFTEKLSAVRELANVLEHLLPLLKATISKPDESALFNIANNFCIRHNDVHQKKDYSIEWLEWIFHVYLATIHFAMLTRERTHT